MVWGLEIMLRLVEADHVSVEKAIEVAESIHVVNPLYITEKIVNAFRREAQHKNKSK